MFVSDMMSKEIVSVSSEESVQNLISLIEHERVHEVLVIDKEKLIGMISSKRLTQKSIADPAKTKVKSLLMSPPPQLNPNNSIDDAAKKILKSGLRALPVCEEGKVVGVLSIHDLIDEISKTKAFRQTSAGALMSPTFTMNENDDIGKARYIMRDHNISRVPIVDINGKLKGIVTTFDMIKAIKTKERIGDFAIAAEMERIMQIPISTIMNKNPVTANMNDSLTDIAVLFNREKTSGIVITEDNEPKGIIVPKDLLEFHVGGLTSKGIFYQVVGLAGEDEFIAETANKMIENTLKKLAGAYTIKTMVMHIKKHDLGGEVKYVIRIRLLTDTSVFMGQSGAWDLRAAVKQALENLERIMFKTKDIARQSKREGKTKIKKLRMS